MRIMRNTIRLSLLIATLSFGTGLRAQNVSNELNGLKELTFTLGEVVDIAVENSNISAQAKMVLETEKSDFDSFIASRKWQLGLNFNPSYQLTSLPPETYSVSGFSNTNALSAGATLNFSKLISGTGGYAYASSNLAWSEYFSESGDSYRQMYGAPRLLGTTPIRVGYRQELIGYNGSKWDKKIRDKQYENAGKEYVAAMAAISETAAGYFFSYATCKALYDMYKVNAESADSLYRIGLKKYDLTSIRKDELLSLQLQLMNSQNDVRSSYNSMENARRSLLSYLNMGYKDVSVEVVLPDNPDHYISVDAQQAIDMAKRYNPEFGQAEEASLRAQQELDRAKREKGLQANLDLSVGLQKFGYDFNTLGSTNKMYSMANVTLGIPIVDHGMRRNNYNAAKKRAEYYDVQKVETERIVVESIVNTVNELQIQQMMLEDTKKAMELADESFRQNQYNYAQGLSDINTFTLAQNRKDSAHINYISSLRDFWLAYYRLCTITLYDFYNMKPLDYSGISY